MVDSAQKYSADVHRRKSLCTLNKKQALSIGSCAIVFIILCVVLLLLLLNGRSEQVSLIDCFSNYSIFMRAHNRAPFSQKQIINHAVAKDVYRIASILSCLRCA
ncbi:hypothetical protein D918_00051 [Trichuris suis]|nr:hypothetical protein D918_00051 [Trichuris suis]